MGNLSFSNASGLSSCVYTSNIPPSYGWSTVSGATGASMVGITMSFTSATLSAGFPEPEQEMDFKHGL